MRCEGHRRSVQPLEDLPGPHGLVAYSSTTALAVVAHENVDARAREVTLTTSGSVAPASSASASPRPMSSTSNGSTRKPASPAISGIDETFDVTVGAPHASASPTGSPNPSSSEKHATAPA